MAVTAKKRKKRKSGRAEQIAGVIVLGVIFVALVVVAIVLFHGQQPRQVAKPGLDALPVLASPKENPYPASDYVFDGERMTLLSGGGIPGIDVSHHQGEIDWQQVAASGVRFAFIRVGYRTYGDGTIHADSYAQANYQGAKDAGIKVGVYFFSQATNALEAMEEAGWTMDAIAQWELDLPVVYDWEIPAEDARTKDVSAGQLTAYTRVFNRILERGGYRTMLYFNRHHAAERLYLHRLTDVPCWFAMYSQEMSYPYEFAIWQYSQTGQVPGIAGNVDLNLMLPGAFPEVFPET